jgi:hypothetical protein
MKNKCCARKTKLNAPNTWLTNNAVRKNTQEKGQEWVSYRIIFNADYTKQNTA